MRHGFVGRPRYSATVVLVEEPIVSLPERVLDSSLRCEEHFRTFVIYFFIFVDILEVGHHEFVLQGQSVNHCYYISTLQRVVKRTYRTKFDVK